MNADYYYDDLRDSMDALLTEMLVTGSLLRAIPEPPNQGWVVPT